MKILENKEGEKMNKTENEMRQYKPTWATSCFELTYGLRLDVEISGGDRSRAIYLLDKSSAKTWTEKTGQELTWRWIRFKQFLFLGCHQAIIYPVKHLVSEPCLR